MKFALLGTIALTSLVLLTVLGDQKASAQNPSLSGQLLASAGSQIVTGAEKAIQGGGAASVAGGVTGNPLLAWGGLGVVVLGGGVWLMSKGQ